MSKVQINKGTYRGEVIVNEVFTLAKPYSIGGINGGFVTVDGTGKDGYPQRNVRIYCEATGFTLVGDNGKIEKVVEETDKEISARLEEDFTILDEMAVGCINNSIRGLIVTGPPGVGKSFGIEKQMEKHALFDMIGVRKEFYQTVKGFITPIGLYKKLFECSQTHNVLIFDDCDIILQDETSLNLLKAALDTGSKRRICWNAESRILRQEDLPNSFDFNGSVIFITNLDFNDVRSKKMVAHLEALQSRCHYIDLGMATARERVIHIRNVVSKGEMFNKYKFSGNEVKEVMNFIESNMDSLNELSLRMCLKVADLRKASPERWERMAVKTCTGRKGPNSAN
jgi:hypothetical protein